MNKLFLAAALLMATTSAHASNSVSFGIDGHKVRIEAPKHCDKLSCIQISAPGLSGFNLNGFKSKHADDVATAPLTPAPAPAVQAAAPQTTAPVASPTPATSTAVASTNSVPGVGFDAPAAATAQPAPVQPAPVASAPVAAAPAAATPLGIWATEGNKGSVRVEQCGANLCGYGVNSGDKILINMKPQESKWTGQIHDPNSGRNYDSTIAMKGPNAMRVQGCAFGGMFCGGQTWKRVS
jgi:uncharacterized protein (DUF2147 family)